MKRFLSVFLSLVLIFTCSSVVFAEEAEPLSAEEIAAMIDSGELKLGQPLSPLATALSLLRC